MRLSSPTYPELDQPPHQDEKESESLRANCPRRVRSHPPSCPCPCPCPCRCPCPSSTPLHDRPKSHSGSESDYSDWNSDSSSLNSSAFPNSNRVLWRHELASPTRFPPPPAHPFYLFRPGFSGSWTWTWLRRLNLLFFCLSLIVCGFAVPIACQTGNGGSGYGGGTGNPVLNTAAGSPAALKATWSALAETSPSDGDALNPPSRCHHFFASVGDGTFLMYGGQDASQVYLDSWLLSNIQRTPTWNQLSDTPNTHVEHTRQETQDPGSHPAREPRSTRPPSQSQANANTSKDSRTSLTALTALTAARGGPGGRSSLKHQNKIGGPIFLFS